MSTNNNDFKQQVADATDIVDVISQYVPLKKKGRNYTACCPFHSEKTPSFIVSPDKKIFHCFGCGAGGDVFTFVMKKENIQFYDTLKMLAQRAGIEIPKYNKQSQKQLKEREDIYNANREAGNYYYKNLKNNNNALGYLVDRGINASIIREFGLGYSKSDWSDLYFFLKKRGFTDEELLDSGLIKTSKNNKKFDMFRNRLMFPIQDALGKVIAFGGRVITSENNGPKYLNTADTKVFNKRYHLYNLNRAKAELRDKPLILVEGYMDVIALYSYGFKNVAAALGTAFTSDHIKLISRYTNDVVLCFDGDSAGEKATSRALAVLNNSDLNISVIRLPVEHDPDSFIRENGTEAFEDYIENAIPAKTFEINQIEKKYNLHKPGDIINFLNESCAILKNENPIEKDYYAQYLSKITGIRVEAIEDQIKNNNSTKLEKIVVRPKKKRTLIPKEFEEAQIYFLGFAIDHPDIIKEAKLNEFKFSKGFFRFLFERLKDLNKANPTEDEIFITENLNYLKKYYSFLKIIGKNNIDEKSVKHAIEVINKYYRQKEIDRLANDLKEEDLSNQQNMFDKLRELKKADWVKV